MFGFIQKKCVSFFRCESMWTLILMGVIALIFFVPVIFDAVIPHAFHRGDISPMSTALELGLMALLFGAFFFISLFVWSEQAYDEREEAEQLQMNKWAFIMGGGAIIVLIMYQSFTGGLDPALPIILFIMLATKLTMKNYYRLRANGYIK